MSLIWGPSWIAMGEVASMQYKGESVNGMGNEHLVE